MKCLALLLTVVLGSLASGQDAFDSAATVFINKDFDFKIEHKGASVLRKLEIPQNGYLRFTFQDPKVNHLVPQATYYDATKNVLGSHEARVSKGMNFIKINDNFNDCFSAKAISATIEFFPEMDLEADSFENPRNLRPDSQFEFAIMPLKDVDYFKIDATETGYVRVKMDATDIKHLDPKPQILDANKTAIGTYEARIEQGKSYFLTVTDAYNNRSSPKTLRGEIQFFPEIDEDPDSFSSPRNIVAGKTFNYAIMPVGDIDFFEFHARETGYVRFTTAATGVQNLDPDVEILNSNQNRIGGWEARVEKGKTYVARIQDKFKDLSAPIKLDAQFEFFVEQDRHEPNNDLDHVIAAELDQVYKFSIMPVKDVDFFKVDVPGGGMVWAEISHSNIKNLTPMASVYDENKQVLSKAHYAQVMGPTTVYFSLYDQWTDGSAPDTFDVTFKFMEEVDLNEPNNLPFMGVAIPENAIVQGAIMPAGDIDFYEVEIKTPGYLRINPLSIPENFNFSFQLCDLDGNALSDWGFDFKVDSGRFLVKAGAGRGQSSAELYSFRVQNLGEFDELERPENEAARLELGKSYPTAIFPKSDVDHWSIELDQMTRIGATYLGQPKGFKQTIQAFNEKGEKVFAGLLPCTLPAGKFVLQATANMATLEGFDFSLIKVSTRDIHEFNDTFESAKALEIGKDYDVFLDVANDLDFFKIKLDQEEMISVDCYYQSLQRIGGVHVHVYDSEKKLIQPIKSVIPRWTKLLAPGEYFIRISASTPRETPIRMVVRTKNSSKTTGALAVAVVGLKLNDKEKELTNLLAESTGSIYIDTNEETSINEAVETAVKEVTAVAQAEPALMTETVEKPVDQQKDDNDKAEEGSGPNRNSHGQIWIVIIPILVLIIAGVVWKKKMKHDPAQ
jgi:hypothetical protein